MIHDGVKKIVVRSLSKDHGIYEIPFNTYTGLTDVYGPFLEKKKYRIMNREHKINAFPFEE